MEVEIEGSSTANYIVTIKDEGGSQTYDIQLELKIDEQNLANEVMECAATEHFWQQIAVDAEREHREFEEVEWAKYAAHLDRMARWYLRGIGDKNPTLTDKRNAAVLLFASNSKNDPIITQAAYQGFCAECKQIGVGVLDKATFITDVLYACDSNFEDVKAYMLALQYKTERLKAISSAFNAKSWAVKTMAADARARISANI